MAAFRLFRRAAQATFATDYVPGLTRLVTP
jgi:hypothetical protein